MKITPLATAALVALALTGCVITPSPPATLTEPPTAASESAAPVTPTPAPVIETPTPEATAEPAADPAPAPVAQPVAAPDEDAFFDAIASGFVIPDLPRMPIPEGAELQRHTLEAGYSICPFVADGSGREFAIGMAESMLNDPSIFTPAMPTQFVDAADTHLCS